MPNYRQFKIDKKCNRKIGQAMMSYEMLDNGDRVLVAISGGIDSLVMACILKLWCSKAPIDYEIIAIHIDHGFKNDSGESVQKELARHGIHCQIIPSPPSFTEENINCYQCSRQRRKYLFDLARNLNCNKIALGHHKDDIIETFFLNILYSGNISTMLPKQSLFDGKINLIRPMAFLEKNQITGIAEKAGIKAVKNPCPLNGKTKRENIREKLDLFYNIAPGVKASIFTSLSNVKTDYLLTPAKSLAKSLAK
jgi:tRNA 2-thiocytidine biosynthesis protein TtcA